MHLKSSFRPFSGAMCDCLDLNAERLPEDNLIILQHFTPHLDDNVEKWFYWQLFSLARI